MEHNKEAVSDLKKEEAGLFKIKLRQLAECKEIVSVEVINAIGDVTKDVEIMAKDTPSSEFDEDLEEEYRNLNNMLGLPNDTYSLTKITAEFLPSSIKYGVRSGLIHLNMPYFSPLSRGYQVITNDDANFKKLFLLPFHIKAIFKLFAKHFYIAFYMFF